MGNGRLVAAAIGVGVAAIDHIIDPLIQQNTGFAVCHAAGDGRHHPLRVVFCGEPTGNDGGAGITGYQYMLTSTGTTAGGSGFLAYAVAGIYITEVIQVVTGIGGGALVVMAVLAIHLQIGSDPALDIRR